MPNVVGDQNGLAPQRMKRQRLQAFAWIVSKRVEQVIRTWASFLGSEEPSLKLLCSAELQRTNSSPISNRRLSKSAIFLSRNKL